MRAHLVAAILAVVTGCASAGSAVSNADPESRVVFAALACAYERERGTAGAAQVRQLDEEIDRIRAVFRQMNTRPRPCSDPLIVRLARCIAVSVEKDQVVTAWRSDGACSSEDLARYK